MPAKATRPAHLGFLTGMRGLAALFVAMSHVWYQIWPAVPPPYGYGVFPTGVSAELSGWLYYGHFGVVVFIVLSGFCLMLPTLEIGLRPRGGLAGFFRRRARRILPPYYAALALALFAIALGLDELTGSQWDIALPVTWLGVLSHLLLLQDLVESTQINYVFWSIALEVHLYLAFPAILVAFRRWGAERAAGTIVVTIYAVIGLLEWAGVEAIPPQFIGLCAHFVLGMYCATRMRLAAGGYETRRGDRPWLSTAALCLGAVVCLTALWGPVVAEGRFAALDLLCAVAACALILGCGRSTGRAGVRRLLEGPRLLLLGDFSYSLYLVHAPLLHAVWLFAVAPRVSDDDGRFLLLMLLGLPASMLCAWLFFLVFERPFSRSAPAGVTLPSTIAVRVRGEGG